jgi:hypothetical protein
MGAPVPSRAVFFFGPHFFVARITKYIYILSVKRTSTTPIQPNRHTARREIALGKLAQTGPLLEGSLCSVKRPGCAKPGWQLTFKQMGKTRTVYVPMELVAEVKQWTRNHRRLKKLIRDVSRHSLAIIRGHVAARRAAERFPASTPD